MTKDKGAAKSAAETTETLDEMEGLDNSFMYDADACEHKSASVNKAADGETDNEADGEHGEADSKKGESCGRGTAKGSVAERLRGFIRNRQTWGFIVSVAVMAIISVAFFYPANFEGRDLRQHDMVQGTANGQEIQSYLAETGEKSWWTNSLFGGMPAFQISPTYGSDSAIGWVNKVYGLGLPEPSNLLFMMMLGFMILMVTLKVRWEYSLIGAIAWGFSTYFIIIIGAGHLWKFITLAYIPPTIAGILLAYRGRYLAGGAMAAFFAMMQLSSNHIQMSYYFGFVIVAIILAYFAGALLKKKIASWLKATAALAVAAALAVGANIPNLYHTYKYAKESQRGEREQVEGASADKSRKFNTDYSYGRAETMTLLIPNVQGGATARPVDGTMRLMPLSDLDKAQDYRHQPEVYKYLQQSPQYFGEPESTNGPVYVGAIIFALFIVGCVVVRGPLKWGLLAVTVLSILLAWGRNFMALTDLFIDIVPMYSKFRTPESILVIAEFTMPLLAIMGLYTIVKERDRLRQNFVTLSWCMGLTALVCLVSALIPSIYGSTMDLDMANAKQMIEMYANAGYPREEVARYTAENPVIYNSVQDIHRSMIVSDAWRSFIFIIRAFGALALYAYAKINRALTAAIVGVLVLVDLYSVNKRYISDDSFATARNYTSSTINPTEIDKAIMQDTSLNYRVLDVDRFTSAEPSYFHKMLGGYHSAKLGRYQDLIDSNLLFDPAIFSMLNAKYLVYQGELSENPYAMGNAWFVDDVKYVDSSAAEFDALHSIDPTVEAVAEQSFKPMLEGAGQGAETDVIYETAYAPNRLTYTSETASDRVAVFSEVYFPWGWKATVDGEPAEIARVNYLLRAVKVPAGRHEIVMTFDPDSVHTTVTVAWICIAIIYLWVLGAIACGVMCPCCRCRKADKGA